MEIIKTESKQKLVKLDDLKPGDLFEFYDQLYMKSDKINSYSFKLIGCILLYNGHYCEIVHDAEVYPARLDDNKLKYVIEDGNELDDNSNDNKIVKDKNKVYEIITVDELTDKDKLDKMPFIVKDLSDEAIYLNKPICNIINYDANCKEEKQDIIMNECINKLGRENYIFVTTAYVPIQEYPESEYYIGSLIGTNNNNNKKSIPVDKVIREQGKMLEEIGFTNINDICRLVFCSAYLYTDNEVGKSIINKFVIDNMELV